MAAGHAPRRHGHAHLSSRSDLQPTGRRGPILPRHLESLVRSCYGVVVVCCLACLCALLPHTHGELACSKTRFFEGCANGCLESSDEAVERTDRQHGTFEEAHDDFTGGEGRKDGAGA